MIRSKVIFLGAFVALAASWTGLVLVNHVSYGRLEPHFDTDESTAFPVPAPGIAARGQLVYQDLGCVACHTQQVRRPGIGADTTREWGPRQSVARDYIREERVLLGSNRIGPDLRNIAARRSGEEAFAWHVQHLYDPQITSPGSVMPPYRFLFETRKVVGQKSADAVDHLLAGHAEVPAGHEIVLTERGRSLVQYLLTRQDSYEGYPEMQNFVTEPEPAPEGEKKEHAK